MFQLRYLVCFRSCSVFQLVYQTRLEGRSDDFRIESLLCVQIAEIDEVIYLILIQLDVNLHWLSRADAAESFNLCLIFLGDR